MGIRKLKTVLLIGGSDPSCGAGIQADLAALNDLDVPAACVISALTAQNAKKFKSHQAVSPTIFLDQLTSLNLKPHSFFLKIGMLANEKIVQALLDWLKQSKPLLSVLDPVFRSSTGAELLSKKGQKLLLQHLNAFDLITPNIPEFEILSGIKVQENNLQNLVQTWMKKQKASFSLLLKGGHHSQNANDLFFSDAKMKIFKAQRIEGKKNVHGTGCSFASYLCGALASGMEMEEAILLAKRKVRKKIESSSE